MWSERRATIARVPMVSRSAAGRVGGNRPAARPSTGNGGTLAATTASSDLGQGPGPAWVKGDTQQLGMLIAQASPERSDSSTP